MRATMKRSQSTPCRTEKAARLGAPGDVLVLPAATPYDLELLCDHAIATARLRGAVRLRVGAVDCEVRREPIGSERRCHTCARTLVQVSMHLLEGDVCVVCARRWLATNADSALRWATESAYAAR